MAGVAARSLPPLSLPALRPALPPPCLLVRGAWFSVGSYALAVPWSLVRPSAAGIPVGTPGGFSAGFSAAPAPPPSRSPWKRVETPQGTYYWNRLTGETTAVGAPPPVPGAQAAPPTMQQSNVFQDNRPGVSLGQSMRETFLLGFGLAGGMVLVRVLLGG